MTPSLIKIHFDMEVECSCIIVQEIEEQKLAQDMDIEQGEHNQDFDLMDILEQITCQPPPPPTNG